MAHATCLLLIDVQKGNYENMNNYYSQSPLCHPELIAENVPLLLEAFRGQHVLIIHVFHHSRDLESPLHVSSPGNSPCDFALPRTDLDELIFTKSVNSSFVGTPLEETLKNAGVKRLVVCGLVTDHCVSTTVRFAKNLDVVGSDGEIWVVSDATATYAKGKFDAETVHAVNLASLEGEFAKIASTKEIVDLLNLG